MNTLSNVSIENAHIIFRNFSGEESKFNKKGSRNFGVLLDVDLAAQLKSDGWNVKELPPREDGDIPTYLLPVSVAFGHIPPKIMLVTSNNMATLDETTVNQLDYAELANIDMIVRPYCWEVNGNSGAVILGMFRVSLALRHISRQCTLQLSKTNLQVSIREIWVARKSRSNGIIFSSGESLEKDA